MSQYGQNSQTPGAYPPPPVSTGAYTTSSLSSPPPGYPTRDASHDTVAPPSKAKTKSRGDGFWKGCCAALCCCCAIDVCCD